MAWTSCLWKNLVLRILLLAELVCHSCGNLLKGACPSVPTLWHTSHVSQVRLAHRNKYNYAVIYLGALQNSKFPVSIPLNKWNTLTTIIVVLTSVQAWTATNHLHFNDIDPPRLALPKSSLEKIMKKSNSFSHLQLCIKFFSFLGWVFVVVIVRAMSQHKGLAELAMMGAFCEEPWQTRRVFSTAEVCTWNCRCSPSRGLVWYML